jgi:hypothetical protein
MLPHPKSVFFGVCGGFSFLGFSFCRFWVCILLARPSAILESQPMRRRYTPDAATSAKETHDGAAGLAVQVSAARVAHTQYRCNAVGCCWDDRGALEDGTRGTRKRHPFA